jgi:glycosyltransferase involved in cell wall biosynthesis
MCTVVHLTSVHRRDDTRIRLKQCGSLAEAGYTVSLIVADGMGNERSGDMTILDVGAPASRIDRMFRTTRRVFRVARRMEADVYHLHDPELLLIAGGLRRFGAAVVFDSHEDVVKQVMSKDYLLAPVRRFVAAVYSVFQRFACRRVSALIAATPSIRRTLLSINPDTVTICNYPILSELGAPNDGNRRNRVNCCYVGNLLAERGVQEMVRAMGFVSSDTRLRIAGAFGDARFEMEVRGLAGWRKVDYLGWLDRASLKELLAGAQVGMVVLQSSPNFVEALPIKLFEYMSAGLPVIASDFPLWQEIVERNECGVCVDPRDPKAIAGAIDYFHENPLEASRMGMNGRRAVEREYNWSSEKAKLLAVYNRLTADTRDNRAAHSRSKPASA